MNKLRRQRDAMALAYLRQSRQPKSALEIGNAALVGEARAAFIPNSGKEQIGLSIACELVRRRMATASRDNCFMLNRGRGQ
jgi:hypothetical protein